MKRVWTIVMALSMGALAAHGCDTEDPAADLQNDLDAYVVEINSQVAILCDCWSEFTYSGVQYSDEASCMTGEGEILPARRRCLDDALNQDVAVSQQWVDCVLPLETEAATCLDNKLSCGDPTSPQACVDDYDVGLMNCITLPNSVLRDLDDCG